MDSSQKEADFYAQFDASELQFRKDRRRQAQQHDRALGRQIRQHHAALAQARRRLQAVVTAYSRQRRRVLDVRIQRRSCRTGCIVCPHHRLVFSDPSGPLSLPVTTRALRAHGIKTLASEFRAAQQAVIQHEDWLQRCYREIECFSRSATTLLTQMHAELMAIGFPDYPAPLLPEQSVTGPYTPLPYATLVAFSEWIDNAQFALSFATLHYAKTHARTKYDRAKQGFFGLSFHKRVAPFSPLYAQWKVYFRGYHGTWFSTNKIIRSYGITGNKKEVIRFRWTHRFILQSGNYRHYLDLFKFKEMYDIINKYHKIYLALCIKQQHFLRTR